MTKKRKLVTPVRVTGIIYNNRKIVNTYSDVTNYQKAAIDAFRLLSSREYVDKHVNGKFDQELCKTLVMRHKLSCKGCLLECEMHEWEELKKKVWEVNLEEWV